MATSKGEEGRDRAEDGTGERGRGAEREGPEREGEGPHNPWHRAPQCLNPALFFVNIKSECGSFSRPGLAGNLPAFF